MGNQCVPTRRSTKSYSSLAMKPEELAYYEKAKMYENQQDYSKAQFYYLQALKTNPSSVMSYCGLGTCQIKIGKFQKAVGFYQKALELDKNCPYAYTGLGVIYQNTKMYKESIYNFNKSIKIDPQLSYPYNGLGNLYYAQKNYYQALKNYQISQRLEPNNPVILANIACCQLDLGKLEEAFVSFNKVKQVIDLKKNQVSKNEIYFQKLKQFENKIALQLRYIKQTTYKMTEYPTTVTQNQN